MKNWTIAIIAVAVTTIVLFSYAALIPRMNIGTSTSQTIQLSTVQTISQSSSESTTYSDSQTAETNQELLAIAAGGYSNGPIPVGDGKYTFNSMKEGYIDYCALPTSGGGATGKTPWIQNGMGYPSEKPTVEGAVNWRNAYFTDKVSGDNRILNGNGLSVNY